MIRSNLVKLVRNLIHRDSKRVTACSGLNGNGKGAWAEDLACTYLCAHGLELLARNYRTRFGEIDMIMRENDWIVFVEVRSRQTVQFVSPEESVNWRKQQRLRVSAHIFLQQLTQGTEPPCRFDVIGISGTCAHPDIEWIKDAFE